MFSYDICTQADRVIFIKQCAALEKHIPNLKKMNLLVDVDGSETQIYQLNGKKLTVHNSYYIDAVYIRSEFEIEPYFC